MTNLTVASGKPYLIVKGTGCCSNTMGPAWLDWPYVQQANYGANPSTDPLFMIRTAVSDTNATANPALTFSVNRCASVEVVFGEEGSGPAGTGQGYPSFLAAQGFECSVMPGGGGTVATFYHETLGSADQVSGPYCYKSFPAGTIALGPREGTSSSSKMYTVFINAADDCTVFGPGVRARR